MNTKKDKTTFDSRSFSLYSVFGSQRTKQNKARWDGYRIEVISCSLSSSSSVESDPKIRCQQEKHAGVHRQAVQQGMMGESEHVCPFILASICSFIQKTLKMKRIPQKSANSPEATQASAVRHTHTQGFCEEHPGTQTHTEGP